MSYPSRHVLPALARLSLLLTVALGGACGGDTSPRPAQTRSANRPSGMATPSRIDEATARDSHRHMLAALRDIQERTHLENLWQGEGAAELARRRLAELPAEAPPALRWRTLMEAGYQELRMGEEKAAIARYREAYELLPRLVGELSVEEAGRTVFRLGVAWMRYGETRNCAQGHSGESCILPLRGDGIHTDKEGSRNAIRYFREVLEGVPRESLLHAKALWLMNLAFMTLGEYPDGVPEPYRIPQDVFASDVELPRFENIAPRLGMDTFNLFGGAIADDFDGDGWLDVMTTTFDVFGQMRLFHNDRDGTFTDTTRQAGLEGLFGGLNLVQADYDNDGDLDVFILRGAWLSVAGHHPNSLLRNEGGGVFTDVTYAAGLAEPAYPTQTASWADYDNDGDVDLFVGNEHGDEFFDAPCQLFRNDGDGTFTDVAAAAGVDHRGFVKGVTWGDYDADRYPDLYVSTMGGRNRLYHNNGDGTFSDVARQAGVVGPLDSFPVWFWDYDNDGNLDLYVPSYRGVVDAVGVVAASYFGAGIAWELPALYRGDGRGGFVDVASEVGLTRFHLPMGANFGDLDNDGWLDFYLGTGYPDYEALMPNVFYLNMGGEAFADVTLAGGFGHLQKGHAVSFFDFDHDGDQDVFEQMGGVYPGDAFSDAFFLNPGFGNHWIAFELAGRRSNRAALGARIRVDVVEGRSARSVHRHVTSGGSFGSNPLRQTVGLGRATTISAVEIYWPTSDTTQRFEALEPDRLYRIVEGESEAEPVVWTGRAGSSTTGGR